MYDAVMSTVSVAVTQQPAATVSSIAATQPANTPVVGSLPTVPTPALTNSAVAQNTNVADKDQASSHGRDRDRYRDRSRSRERSRRERSRSRDRHRDSDRSRDRSRDRRRGRDRSRDRERGRDRSRSRGRDRERSRSGGRDRDRSRSRGRDRSRGRYRDRSRSRDRDRRQSRDDGRSSDHDKRDDGKRKSRWDTFSSHGEDTKQPGTSQMPSDNNPQQFSGMAAANVQSLLNAGRMASAEQPVVNPLMSGAVTNPSNSNIPSLHGRADPSYGLTPVEGSGPGLLTAPGMANPAGVVGPNDAGKVANQNVGQNVQRFPGNVGANNVGGDMWQNSFGASNVPHNNPSFPNMVGMPQGPRMGGPEGPRMAGPLGPRMGGPEGQRMDGPQGPRMGVPDTGRPYQMDNVSDNMGRFGDPRMMNEAGGNSSSGSMNNFMRPQGTTGRFPPPHNMDNMQGFGNRGGTAGSDNFGGMERSGRAMSGHVNNMQQSSGAGMRMPVSGEGPHGFAPGQRFPGADNMVGMQGQGARMMLGNTSRMPQLSDTAEAGEPRSMLGDSTGPFQRPPYDGQGRFGNMTGMPGGDMQSGGSGSGNFTNMTGAHMSGMMSNRPESGMVRDRMPDSGKPGGIRPFFNQSASPHPPTQVPPPLLSQSGNQGNTNSAVPPVPPPPPPPPESKNLTSSMTAQPFGPVPVGVPAPPPSQGSVTDQQTAEQMQAAMAYYYTQWMQQQQQQQPQPPPPPPPPPK